MQRIKFHRIIVGILLAVSIAVAGNEMYRYIRGVTATYPYSDINGYIAWGAGGATDTTSRAIALHAQQALGVNIILQNKTGATGAIATEYVAHQKADGYSLLFNAENPTLYRVLQISDVDYEDYVPVILFGVQTAVVIVPPDSPFANMEDILEYAKDHPGELNMGISGIGGLPFNVACMLESTSGVTFNQVPFDGDAAIVSALLGGHIDLSVVNYSAAADPHRSGDLQIISVLDNDRLAAIPEVEAISERYPEYAPFFPWGAFTGVFADRKTEPEKLAVLTEAFEAGFQSEAFQAYLKDNYIKPLGIGGEEAMQYVRRWQSVTAWLLYDGGAVEIPPDAYGIQRLEDLEVPDEEG